MPKSPRKELPLPPLPGESTRLTLSPRAPFHFTYTVLSHGWVSLAPNAWDATRLVVRRVEQLASGQVVALEISGEGTLDEPLLVIQAHHAADLTSSEQDEIREKVGYMFRAEEGLSEFYALARERGGRWLRVTEGLGRLFRSPTLFEDTVKAICTTNIQWGGTQRMVAELVTAYGAPYPADPTLRAFPTPAAIAAVSPEAFAESVHLGYRTPFVYALAQRIATGELDLEAWRDPALPTRELQKKLLTLKGVGPYAAATLLMLLGRYDELAVDTAFRMSVSKRYFPGQRPSDAEMQAVYADWGCWKYLAYWFDIWESFHPAPEAA